jgi:hypothetical protein
MIERKWSNQGLSCNEESFPVLYEISRDSGLQVTGLIKDLTLMVRIWINERSKAHRIAHH